MLKICGLSKYYGSHQAIDDVSFVVKRGEVTGLLGHNGSGKSTTLNIISGIISATHGSVFIDGIDIAVDPINAKIKIGYLPENPPLYLDMTVDEQLLFASELRGLPAQNIECEIIKSCERLNITGVRKRLIKNLSKGYRQRVGFAQALLGSPDLLILDEPTVGLDAAQIVEIRTLINTLKQHHAIIFSSHILTEVTAICDKVVVLSNGHLVAADTPANLIKQHSHSGTYILRIEGDSHKIEMALSGIASITKFTHEAANVYVIEGHGDDELCRELFFTMAQAKCPILLIKPIDVSLEDIFLTLTTDKRYEVAK